MVDRTNYFFTRRADVTITKRSETLLLEKGDFVGHPFRGNQWSDASGASTSGGESTQESQTAVMNAWGGMFASDYDSGADAGGFMVDEEGMNDFIARQHTDLSLTKTERESVQTWQSYDYADINAVLRGEAKLESFDAVKRNLIETTITSLNKILTKTTLDQDVVVFRGINDEEFMFEEVMNGDIIKDAGFIATSLNPIIATMGAEGMIEGGDDWALNPLVFRIKLPKGTPAFAVEKLNGAITNPKGPFMNPDAELLAQQGYTHGSEIVLPPNTSFRVVRESNVERQRVLDLEVIPNA